MIAIRKARNKNERFILVITTLIIFILVITFFGISPYITLGVIIFSLFYIRLLQGWYLGNGLEVSHKHFFRLKQIVEELSEKLRIKEPKLIIQQDPNPNAFTLGYRHPYTIVLTSSLVEYLNEEELEAVIAHELGHAKFQHPRVSSIVNPAGQNIFLLTWIFSFWQRSSEYTADRVSQLITEDPRSLVTSLMKIGIGPHFLDQIDEEELLSQAKVEQKNLFNRKGEWTNNHPYLLNRINRIMLFAQENSFPYRKGGTMFCTNCGTKISVSAKFCPNCGSDVRKD